MDIKQKVEDAVKKITSDKSLMEEFKKEPVKAVEKVIGKDLPDDAVKKVVDGVKAKLTVDKAGSVVGAIKKML